MAALFRRLLFSAVALLAVCSFSFFLIHAVPGDPVDLILGDQASAAQRLSLQHELGLDRSLGQQYIQFFLAFVARGFRSLAAFQATGRSSPFTGIASYFFVSFFLLC